MTEVELIFFIAEKRINRWMECLDLKRAHKVYVTAKESIRFTTETKVDRDYIMNIIEKSRDNDGFWIPAIMWDDKLYAADEIKVLSDGHEEMFIERMRS